MNWFAAFPRSSSDSASLTRELAPLLAETVELVFWSHETGWDPALEQHGEVRVYDAGMPPWGDFNRAPLTLFHLGDDFESFGPIWTISRRLPGIVTLHAESLQPFLTRLVAQKRFLTVLEYLGLSEFHHPGAGRTMGELYLRDQITLDELSARCPLDGAAAANALAVLRPVPSKDAFLTTLLAAIEDLPQHEAAWCARVMSRRVGEAIAGWSGVRPKPELLPRIQRAIAELNAA
ncbi:MAG: hypothetical protein ACR2ID_08015 [Chthoniobacterales bacterium]